MIINAKFEKVSKEQFVAVEEQVSVLAKLLSGLRKSKMQKAK